jgi:transposase
VSCWPDVRCCCEAGLTGFGLHRHLVERGIDSQVVAPGLVPTRPGERVKTDPRDARRLARLLTGGLLEPIYVPAPELEAARDLVRAREDARLDLMRDRHGLSKFCLRHGRRLPAKFWAALAASGCPSSGSSSPPSSRPSTPTCTRSTWPTTGSRRSSVRSGTAEHGALRELVARLRCLRGVDTLTALGIVVEIGDEPLPNVTDHERAPRVRTEDVELGHETRRRPVRQESRGRARDEM